jgi:outer membrane lipopolysaccharide assembly protein LptE/RlpB
MHFYKFFWLISVFLVSNCSFNQLAISSYNIENYIISSDKTIPALLNTRIRNVFSFSDGENNSAKAKIYIKNFSKQDYSIYAGSALRSLEGEITAKIQLKIQTAKKTHKKDIKIVKRYKSNELNPFAEKEMIKVIEENIYKEILDEIIREVNFFEM